MTLRNIINLILALSFTTLVGGCGGGKHVSLQPNVQADIAVVSQRGETRDLTQDQVWELERVSKWMDTDIIKQLNKAGFRATLLDSPQKFKNRGHLLIISVNHFKAGNRAARAFIGYGAGGSSLDLHYQLINSQGKTLQQWDDSVGSSKGGTYCAQTLNRNALARVVGIVNGQ